MHNNNSLTEKRNEPLNPSIMKLSSLTQSIERQKKQKELKLKEKQHEQELIREKKRIEREAKTLARKKAKEAKRELDLELKKRLNTLDKPSEEEEIYTPIKKEIRFIMTVNSTDGTKSEIHVFDKWAQKDVCVTTTLHPERMLPRLLRYYGKSVTKLKGDAPCI